MTKWISVKDRLPDEGIEVLIYTGMIDLDNIPKYEIATYRIFSNASIFVSGPYNIHGVTHWMPLPPTPEEACK